MNVKVMNRNRRGREPDATRAPWSLSGAAKVVVINIAILVTGLWIVNLVSAVYLDAKPILKPIFFEEETERRIALPNYPDKDWARVIQEEMRSVRGDYAPYVGFTRKPFKGRAVNINAEGDRTHRATTDKPIGTVRFFGGSTMWGTGTDDEGTIPAKFNHLEPRYRVHNHGQSAYVSRQGLARLINLANRNKPMDQVVFYDGVNEVLIMCRDSVHLNGHAREGWIRSAVAADSNVVSSLVGSTKKLVDDAVHYLIGSGDNFSRCSDPKQVRVIADMLVENWKMARAIARSRGADFIAILQPVSFIGSPRLDHIGIGPNDGMMWRRAYPILQERIREEKADWIYDMTDAFDGDEYFYYDFCHVTENGNEVIARRIEKIFERRRGAKGGAG